MREDNAFLKCSFVLIFPQTNDDTRIVRWLRPLWECIGNNFIAKIQVPSFPEQHHPRTDTQSSHTHKTINHQQLKLHSSPSLSLTLTSFTNTHLHPLVYIHSLSFSLLRSPSLLLSFCIPLVKT